MSFNSSENNGFKYNWPISTEGTWSTAAEPTENNFSFDSLKIATDKPTTVPISQELHLNLDFLDYTSSGSDSNGSDLVGFDSNYSSLSSARNSSNSIELNSDLFPLNFNFASYNLTNNSETGELFKVNTNNSTFQQTNNTSNIRPSRVSRSDNYCETVAVESSAHVAQIVGKNGCKIKHLRAKFGTYIHTPTNGEEPVFIIKGRREDVFQVKQEIIKAASHFSKIKSSKMDKISNIVNSQNSASIRLFIPNRFIGLVVGRNGWFVKVLQLKFQIYIETPKFDLCNYFRLYGLAENIRQATALIYQHIGNKTGLTLSQKEEGDDIYFVG